MGRLLPVNAAALALALHLVPGGASAAVSFTPWSADGLDALIDAAASEQRLVMVVITQPDWCPNCIRLDRELLRNAQAKEVAELTRGWTVLEVWGYDEAGASMLREQGLAFVGTPTTLLLRPSRAGATLGEAAVVSSVVGYPEDYTERLRKAAEGFDAVREAQQRVREEGTVEAFEALAEAHVEQGNAVAAGRVYQSLLLRDDLDAQQRAEMRWQMIKLVHQLVEKDHERTLAELDAYAADYPEFVATQDYAYARAWSLLEAGRDAEARALLQARFIEPGDAELLRDYLYLAFRHEAPALLSEAEAEARRGIERFPESAARFEVALGRILRRQGRLEEAEAAFARAVADAGEDSPLHTIILGHLEHVRAELQAAGDSTEPRTGL